MVRAIAGVYGVLLVGLAFPAQAEVKLDGTFTASKACPAWQAFRKQTNPGNVQTEPGRAYPVVAGNRANPSHYWIVVDGVKPVRRWVEAGCGTVALKDGSPAPVAGKDSDGKADFVLSISWQPAFCEANAQKPECASQTAERFDATNFSLHGLWSQPRGRNYCGVAPDVRALDKGATWKQLPMPELSPPIRTALDKAMPGTQSGLDRHEWIKHGTCFPDATPDAYFGRSLSLLDQLNASPVRTLFAENIGKEVTGDAIRAAFDSGFGPGSGERVRIACRQDGSRRLISEVTIGLGGTIGELPSLGPLIASAGPTKGGCNGGIIDPAGFQ